VSTTEVFVEQVLIGLLVLLVVAMLCAGSVEELAELAQGDLLQGVAILGAAYLIGIVYDRVADTMLQDVERHARLRFLFKERFSRLRDADPFPEDRLRTMLHGRAPATTQANYLRTRMRLTRALATILPALTTAWVLRQASGLHPCLRWTGLLMLPLLYGLALVSRFLVDRPPRTNDAEKLEDYRMVIARKSVGVCQQIREEPLTPIFLVWLGVSLLLAAFAGRPALVVAVLGGAALTLLCGWVWWRITRTFFRLLSDYEKHAPKDG